MRVLVLDVDGVLTDGGIFLDADRGDMKRFHSRDGVGIQLARTAGWRVLFLSARHSPVIKRRAEELGVAWAMGVASKDGFLESWLCEAGASWKEVAFVGDDLPDLAAMRRAAWPIAVQDAAPEVKTAARYVTLARGGSGAVREAVEWLLNLDGERAQAVESFLQRPEGFSVGGEERGE